MASRDVGFISLRNVTAYEENNSLVPKNRIFATSTNGATMFSNNITISSINVSTLYGSTIYGDTIYGNKVNVSTLTAETAIISTTHMSSVFSINSSITVYNPIILTEDGTQSTLTSANLSVWGNPVSDPINETFTTSATYTINSTISTVKFQLIASGGASTFSNPLISTEDLPGYGTYITGILNVKMGDSLCFTVGNIGNAFGGSGGTSLIYISTTDTDPVSTLVAVAGAGGGNGYSPDLISSSGGGHGGGGTGEISMGGEIDYIVFGTDGYDGLSTIGGVIQSIVDGGRGGGIGGGTGGDGHPTPGAYGVSGQNPYELGDFTNGGIVYGGAGGSFSAVSGGWGGGGYSGGGGGGSLNSGSISTSAGGGGGGTYIATSTLNGILSDVLCLGGQFLSNNNAKPLGDYGTPSNPGFANIFAFSQNDTIYTNGDIQCRVLRYEMLDPPINALGGSSALWSLYHSIHPLVMNNNPITECGSIEVESGGIDVTDNSIFRNQLSTMDKITVVGGGIDVTGDSIFNNQLSTLDKITVTANGVDVTGDSIFNNQLSTLDRVTVTNNGIDVTGDSIFNNQLSTLGRVTVVEGGVDVTGDSIFNNQLSTLGRITVVEGGVDVTGDSIFNNQLSTLGRITIVAGGIDVTGDSIFNNQLSTMDKITVTAGGVDVTGNSIFNNQLSTMDKITVTASGLDITGNSIFKNQLSTLDKITVTAGGVDVTDNSIFKNQVSVLQQLNTSTISSGSAIFTDTRTSGDGIISINGISSSNLLPGLSIHNGDSDLSFFGNLGNTSFNPIVQANDSAIIFRSSQNNGNFTIAPWTSVSSGIRIGASGTTTIYGTTYINLLSSNTISSGVIYSNSLNSNTISSAQITSALVNGREIKWTTPLTYSAPDPGGGAVIWNTATPGIGQSEFINCRGTGSGGFGFYDVAPLSTLVSSVKLVSFDMNSLTVYRSSNTIGLYANLSSGNFTNIVQNNDSAIIFRSSAIGGALVIAPTNTVNCGIRISSNCTTTIYGTTISTIGNSVVTGDLQVNGNFIHPSVSPPGTVTMYAAATAPAGWFVCDGTAISRATYSVLFAIIGTTYGGGDGSTTFNVPDMSNLFVVGTGSNYNLNNKGGNNSITLSESQMPNHNHDTMDGGHSHPFKITLNSGNSGGNPGVPQWGGTNDYGPFDHNGDTGIRNSNISILPRGGNQPFDNRPPYIALNYIIKY